MVLDFFIILISFIMAKCKFGMMMVDARGKLGGHVFTKARNGATIRTKVTPTNPQTSFQALVRNRLASLSSGWSSLSESDRASWNSGTALFPKTNIFGDTYLPSGKNLYIGLNSNLLNAGSSPLPVCPAPIEFPEFFVDSIALHTGVLGLAIDVEGGALDNFVVMYEATAPLSLGIGNFSGRFRQILASQDSPADGPTLQTAYQDKFGSYAVGSQIAFRISLISAVSGQKSASLVVSDPIITP